MAGFDVEPGPSQTVTSSAVVTHAFGAYKGQKWLDFLENVNVAPDISPLCEKAKHRAVVELANDIESVSDVDQLMDECS